MYVYNKSFQQIILYIHNLFIISFSILKDAAGGPIKHSNGLCIFPKRNRTLLVWSSNCSIKNAMFLVSHDYPTRHIASGQYILPQSGNTSDPGTRFPLVLGDTHCEREPMKFRQEINGGLKYFYNVGPYEICLEFDLGPSEGSNVMFSETACLKEKPYSSLTYGKISLHIVVMISWSNSNKVYLYSYTLDYTIRIGSTPTFLYFDLYLYSAYAAHCVYIVIQEAHVTISDFQCGPANKKLEIKYKIYTYNANKR